MGFPPLFFVRVQPCIDPHRPHTSLHSGLWLAWAEGFRPCGPWLRDPSGLAKEAKGTESHQRAGSLATFPSPKPVEGSQMWGGVSDSSTEHPGPRVRAPGWKERCRERPQQREEATRLVGASPPSPPQALAASGRTVRAKVGRRPHPFHSTVFRATVSPTCSAGARTGFSSAMQGLELSVTRVHGKGCARWGSVGAYRVSPQRVWTGRVSRPHSLRGLCSLMGFTSG